MHASTVSVCLCFGALSALKVGALLHGPSRPATTAHSAYPHSSKLSSFTIAPTAAARRTYKRQRPVWHCCTQATAMSAHGLNEAQHAAVTAPVGAIRVVAGPGSGKTRVLTRRIAHLITAAQAPPWSVMAVTFTNKAAAEMRERVEALVGRDAASRIMLGTFHSVCTKLLRSYGDGLPQLAPGLDRQFTVYDVDDCRRVLQEIITQNRNDIDTNVKAGDIRNVISKFKSEGLSPQEVQQMQTAAASTKSSDSRSASDWQLKLEAAAIVYPQYQEAMRTQNAVDFDDLILLTLQLLRADRSFYDRVGQQYRHTLVDEWQDTNGPQYDLVQLLAQAGASSDRSTNTHTAGAVSLFVVGDADQSIYAFRGAVVGNVARFETDFQPCSTYMLLENYRSTQRIAAAADAVIAKVPNRESKSIVTVRPGGLPIGLMTCRDAEHEAHCVADAVCKYWTSGKVPLNEIAIMYRTNAQSRALEAAMLRAGVPFKVIGGQKFFQRKEVRDCLAYLRLLHNPGDRAALVRCINTPPRGIGSKTVDALLAWSDSVAVSPTVCLLALLPLEEVEPLYNALRSSAQMMITAQSADAAAAQLTDTTTTTTTSSSSSSSSSSGHAQSDNIIAPTTDDAADATDVAYTGGAATTVSDPWEQVSFERVHALHKALADGDGTADVHQEPKPAQRRALQTFARLLLQLRVYALTHVVEDLIGRLIVDTDMEEYVKKPRSGDSTTSSSSTVGLGRGEDRWNNIQELMYCTDDINSSSGDSSPAAAAAAAAVGGLEAFLAHVSLMGGDDTPQSTPDAAGTAANNSSNNSTAAAAAAVPVVQDVVRLTTIHGSKGLEFDTVFICGCEEGTLPLFMRSSSKSNGKLQLEDDDERRLMYVGMTRAKSRLYLSWRTRVMRLMPSIDGGGPSMSTEDAVPSRYLSDLPKSAYKSLDMGAGDMSEHVLAAKARAKQRKINGSSSSSTVWKSYGKRSSSSSSSSSTRSSSSSSGYTRGTHGAAYSPKSSSSSSKSQLSSKQLQPGVGKGTYGSSYSTTSSSSSSSSSSVTAPKPVSKPAVRAHSVTRNVSSGRTVVRMSDMPANVGRPTGKASVQPKTAVATRGTTAVSSGTRASVQTAQAQRAAATGSTLAAAAPAASVLQRSSIPGTRTAAVASTAAAPPRSSAAAAAAAAPAAVARPSPPAAAAVAAAPSRPSAAAAAPVPATRPSPPAAAVATAAAAVGWSVGSKVAHRVHGEGKIVGFETASTGANTPLQAARSAGPALRSRTPISSSSSSSSTRSRTAAAANGDRLGDSTLIKVQFGSSSGSSSSDVSYIIKVPAASDQLKPVTR